MLLVLVLVLLCLLWAVLERLLVSCCGAWAAVAGRKGGGDAGGCGAVWVAGSDAWEGGG